MTCEAEEIADGMLDDATRRRMNYSVLALGEPAFGHHWSGRGAYGVTFDVRAERSAAREWIVAALAAGFTVFHSSRRGGWSGGRRLEREEERKTLKRLNR
jgi:hypothetical protein